MSQHVFFFSLFSLPTYFLPLVNFLIENWSRGLSFESSGMFSSNSFRSLFSITIIAKLFVLTLQYFPVNGAPVKIYTGTLSKEFLKIYFYFLLKKFQENITVKCFLLWSVTFALMFAQVFLSLNMVASKKKTLWVEDHFIPFCVYFIWKSRSRQKRFLVHFMIFLWIWLLTLISWAGLAQKRIMWICWPFLSSGKFDYFKEQDKLHRVYEIAVSDKKYIVSSSINSWYEDFVSWAIDKKPGKFIQKSKHMTYWKLKNDPSNQRKWNFPKQITVIYYEPQIEKIDYKKN